MNPSYIHLVLLNTGSYAGVCEITTTEIRYDLLDGDCHKINGSAVNIAVRTTEGIPTEAQIEADVIASMPA